MDSIFGILTWILIISFLFLIRSIYGQESLSSFSLNLLFYFVLSSPFSSLLPSLLDLPIVIALAFYRPTFSSFTIGIYSSIVFYLLSPFLILVETFMTVLCIQGIGQSLQLYLEIFQNHNETIKEYTMKCIIILHFIFSLVNFSFFIWENNSFFPEYHFLEFIILSLFVLLLITCWNEYVMISDFSLILNYVHINLLLTLNPTEKSDWMANLFSKYVVSQFEIPNLLSKTIVFGVLFRLLVFKIGYFMIRTLRGELDTNFDMHTVIQFFWKPALLLTVTQSFDQNSIHDDSNSVIAKIIIGLIFYGYTTIATDESDSQTWRENLKNTLISKMKAG